MLSDRVSNPGPLTYESGALPIALRGLARPENCRVAFAESVPIHLNTKLLLRMAFYDIFLDIFC